MNNRQQVYLRWQGRRGGGAWQTAGSGPWDVIAADDGAVLLDHADWAELERERDRIERGLGVTGAVLQASRPEGGWCETWETVAYARRGVGTGLEIGHTTYPIEAIRKGASYYQFRVVVPCGARAAAALSQQYGVYEAVGRGWCERIGYEAVDFRLPA